MSDFSSNPILRHAARQNPLTEMMMNFQMGRAATATDIKGGVLPESTIAGELNGGVAGVGGVTLAGAVVAGAMGAIFSAASGTSTISSVAALSCDSAVVSEAPFLGTAMNFPLAVCKTTGCGASFMVTLDW